VIILIVGLLNLSILSRLIVCRPIKYSMLVLLRLLLFVSTTLCRLTLVLHNCSESLFLDGLNM